MHFLTRERDLFSQVSGRPTWLALQAGHLPNQGRMSKRLAEALLLDRGKHLRRWVDEGSKLTTQDSEHQVLPTDEEARKAVARRVTEDE